MPESSPLPGKAALVLGAGGGAGRACAIALARGGADVAVASLTLDPREIVQVHSAANEIWSLGRRNLALELDVSGEGEIAGAIAAATAEFGRLDLVVVASGDASLADTARAAGAATVITVAPDDPRPSDEIVAEVLAGA